MQTQGLPPLSPVPPGSTQRPILQAPKATPQGVLCSAHPDRPSSYPRTERGSFSGRKCRSDVGVDTGLPGPVLGACGLHRGRLILALSPAAGARPARRGWGSWTLRGHPGPWRLHLPTPPCQQPSGTPLLSSLSLPLPTLTGHCPLKSDQGKPSCFSRTPLGPAPQSPAPHPPPREARPHDPGPVHQSSPAVPPQVSGCADGRGGAEGACGDRQGHHRGWSVTATPPLSRSPGQRKAGVYKELRECSPKPGDLMLGRVALSPKPWGLTEASGPRRAGPGWVPLPPRQPL